MVQFERPYVLTKISGGIKWRTSFQEHYVKASISQRLSRDATSGARTDNTNIVQFGHSDYINHFLESSVLSRNESDNKEFPNLLISRVIRPIISPTRRLP
jgi:hypothetical protein